MSEDGKTVKVSMDTKLIELKFDSNKPETISACLEALTATMPDNVRIVGLLGFVKITTIENHAYAGK